MKYSAAEMNSAQRSQSCKRVMLRMGCGVDKPIVTFGDTRGCRHGCRLRELMSQNNNFFFNVSKSNVVNP